MKLHFEPDLEHQVQAIEAVCDLFRGQESIRSGLAVTRREPDPGARPGLAGNELGVGNRLALTDAEILANLTRIQLRNGLVPSATLAGGDFTVEMETGTGKTYVYLRTIFELNRRYGFTKFVIVVPSIAIKEGVSKALQITRDHFASLYAGVPFESFLYDSARLGRLLSFAASASIQIMIVTVGAMNKKNVNNLYRASEKAGGEKPIDLIRATRPIAIVDEPQSVDGGLEGQGKRALEAMNPLCTLRYSATHVDEHHRVYRLDAADAYERGLVKRIEVASATVEGAHNRPYLRLIALSSRGGAIGAKVELDVGTGSGVRRRRVAVRDGDDLEEVTGRVVYAGCRIGEIRVARGDERAELRVADGVQWLRLGQAYGDVDARAVQRQMIRRTIREHLAKEQRLRPRGIKVLSLIFVDEVAKYRRYDSGGRPVKGPYARIFEQEYGRLARDPDYRALFQGGDLCRAAEEVHGGYFSIDRRGIWSDTAETHRAGRENAERAYNLIMKEKEALLSFDSPLAFLFSHSALREGWDNPNVFQICTLRDIQTERERRQTIGRGLRLCVDQQGRRLRGAELNTLTVVASERYEQFAESLQREFAEETDIGSRAGRVRVRNADEGREPRLRKEAELAEELQELWEQVGGQITYRVHFDNEKLVERCIQALRDAPAVPGTRLRWREADIAIGKAGAEATARRETTTAVLEEDGGVLRDVLSELQDRTQLTRRTIARVLAGSGRLADFARNPQAFIELAGEAIERCKRLALGRGVRYGRLGGAGSWAQELCEREELRSHEAREAGQPEGDGTVRVYAGLPAWFLVPTPLGSFHPQRAVRVPGRDGERLYFVAEAVPGEASGVGHS